MLEFIIISLILSAALVVVSELLRPKPHLENARPAALGDFRFPTATEGRVVPLVWGTIKIEGPNVVWYGDLVQSAIKKKVKTGLWSSKRLIVGYRYSVGIQFALCRGPINLLRRVWVGGKEVESNAVSTENGIVLVDKGDLFGGDDLGAGGVAGNLRVHLGGPDQAVDAYLSTRQDPITAYRGTCYCVFERGYVGNSTDIQPWAFEVQRLPNNLGIPDDKWRVNTFETIKVDANPMEVLYELLTDADYGFGFSPTLIDVANFVAAGVTLHDEGNGFSFLMDSPREALELKREIERQTNGVLYLDQVSGKFRFALAREDYDVDLIRQLTAASTIEIRDFTRGTWEETKNQVRASFSSREGEYSDTYAVAADLANQRIQGGTILPTTRAYPGCKSAALASQLASRDLKSLALPLAKAVVTVDRTFWDVHVGEVIAWTAPPLGFVKVPMRVVRVNFGSLLDGKVELTLVQDIFSYKTSPYGSPPSSLWTGPSQAVAPFPSTQQRALEAPWALVRRDPDKLGVSDRVFAAGRAQTGQETGFQIVARHAAGTPSGAFSLIGEVQAFALVGALRADLSAGTAQPTATISIDPSPDALASLAAALESPSNVADLGQNLVNLVMVDDEFLLVTSTQLQTGYLDLKDVYRGVMDSAPAAHAAGAEVWLLTAGAGLSDVALPPGDNVDVKLRPNSRTDEVAESSATTISFQMKNRVRRPLPPAQLAINSADWPASVDLDTLRPGGATLDERGAYATFVRRDWWTLDEVKGVTVDAGTLDDDFPTADDTRYKARVTKDPGGTPVVLFTTELNGGDAFLAISRTKILRYNGGAKPATLRVEVFAHHTMEGTGYDALQALAWDFSVAASTLDDDFDLGVLDENVTSAAWTAPTSGSYGFTVGTPLATGHVEAQVNGGGWSTIVSAGSSTGTLAGVTAGDTVEVRHTQGGDDSTETLLAVDAPSSTADAYAVLVT